MAHVIAVATLKGGVGKSTVSLNVATCLHQSGTRVLLIDTDNTTRTLRKWAKKADELGHEVPPVVSIDGQMLRRELERVSSAFEVVIIDCAPNDDGETRSAMLAADLVLMPVIPGGPDVWAVQETIAVLEQARGFRPEIKARLLFNRADRTALSRTAWQAIEGMKIQALVATLRQRVAIGEATLTGTAVVSSEPSSDAAREVRRMTKEIVEVLRG